MGVTAASGAAEASRYRSVEVVFFDLGSNKLFDYKVPPELQGKAIPGVRVLAPFGPMNALKAGMVVGKGGSFTGVPKPIARVLDARPLVTHSILSLAKFAAGYYSVGLGKILERCIPPVLRGKDSIDDWIYDYKLVAGGEPPQKLTPTQASALKLIGMEEGKRVSVAAISGLAIRPATVESLVRLGLVSKNKGRFPMRSAVPSPRELTDEQTKAIAAFDAMDSEQVMLLDGITNSGKTEVYAQLVQKTYRQGNQTLVLVPEVALVEQVANAIASSIGIVPVELHGGLSRRARLHAWIAARSAPVVVGTPQNLLVPMEKLALVIVDEEHASSYKLEPLSLNIRDLALQFRTYQPMRVVLGSATPSLYSLRNTNAGPKFLHQRLRKRIGNSQVPSLSVKSIPRKSEWLSQEVLESITAVLEANKHVLILRNRRGFAAQLVCQRCDWVATCPSCEIYYSVYYTPRSELKCFRCSSTSAIPPVCPECQGSVMTRGIGTQRLEEELKQRFPEVNVLRLDSDIPASEQRAARSWLMSPDREGAICVGTQMLSKGHDFQRVGMVIATGMDILLHSSQERIKETLVQLLYQVAGRAGRDGSSAEFLLLSSFPQHGMWRKICENDYETLAADLLNIRKDLLLPPYRHAVHVAVKLGNEQRLRSMLNNVGKAVKRVIEHQKLKVQLSPPIYPYAGKVDAKYVGMLRLIGAERRELKSIQRSLQQHPDLQYDRYIDWDVDPVEHF